MKLSISFVIGRTVGCFSACAKYNTDAYCCKGAHNKPETCKSSNRFLKQACPQAYSFAYDDNTSTFTCKNTDYTIQFC